MNASHILDSIRAKYPNNALVPELTISDPRRFDYWLPTEETRERGILPYRRIDALMFQSFERTAIEVKVTRADYRLDTEEKRWPWHRVVHRFIYAVPADLDVMSPHGCGLWKVHPDGKIDVVKKAIINRTPEPLPQEVIQRLAYRAAGQIPPEENR